MILSIASLAPVVIPCWVAGVAGLKPSRAPMLWEGPRSPKSGSSPAEVCGHATNNFRLVASAILAATLVGCSGSNAPLGGETARGEPDPSGLLGSAAGASDGLAADTTGVYIADSGFRPTADGFSFENYGNDAVPANLGPAELQALFGNEVCNDEIADRCSLSSAAVTWMHQINQAMAGGHCEGMAVLSQLFDEGSRSPSTFGSDTAWELDLQESPGLAPAIAKWFATQVTSPTSESTLTTLSPTRSSRSSPRRSDNRAPSRTPTRSGSSSGVSRAVTQSPRTPSRTGATGSTGS
ncbi:MAG: hypothetical protein R2789_10470 [Microthrixaceae bacterium]